MWSTEGAEHAGARLLWLVAAAGGFAAAAGVVMCEAVSCALGFEVLWAARTMGEMGVMMMVVSAWGGKRWRAGGGGLCAESG